MPHVTIFHCRNNAEASAGDFNRLECKYLADVIFFGPVKAYPMPSATNVFVYIMPEYTCTALYVFQLKLLVIRDHSRRDRAIFCK